MIVSALDNLTHPPEAVVGFIRKLVDERTRYEGPERRAESRRDITVPITVQLLDDNYRPIAPPANTSTFNLSGGGVGFLFDAPVKCNFALVRLELSTGESLNLIASIRHCTRVGFKYHVGARFVVKWNNVSHHGPASEA